MTTTLLKVISLASTSSVGDVHLDAGRQRAPHKSDFWQRLSQGKAAAPSLDQLYEWDQGQASDAPLDVLFQSVLDGEMSDVGKQFSGTLRTCLCDEGTAVEVLEALKDWANVQRASRSEALPGDVASAIYYGAIAAALVRWEEKITGLNDQAMAAGFKWVCGQEWLDGDVRATVQAARDSIDQ